jgi:hypothetical protein
LGIGGEVGWLEMHGSLITGCGTWGNKMLWSWTWDRWILGVVGRSIRSVNAALRLGVWSGCFNVSVSLPM